MFCWVQWGCPYSTASPAAWAWWPGPPAAISCYLPLALICGLAVAAAPKNRVGQFIGMILGTAVLYALGTAWYCVQSGNPLGVAMGYCVIPFLPGDFIKMIVAAGVGPMIRTGLEKAGLYPQG